MNYRAEKIDQMIKMINRNLLLISSGQTEDIIPLDFKHLQKVDTSIFGHDKFAFDMVHFVESYRKNKEYNLNKTITYNWEKDFIHGLEALLVECALVGDDIERDCFVSRVYRWFTEKLNDRRELPHNNTYSGSYDELKESIRSLGVSSSHTINAINKYSQSPNKNDEIDLESPAKNLLKVTESMHSRNDSFFDKEMTSARRLLLSTNKSISRNKALTMSRNNHVHIPDIFTDKSNNLIGGLPTININTNTNTNSNYGLLYNKPVSEAEKSMNDMWLAKRKQEAFDWKSQQQMSLVMDRLSLQKSRMESDTLRRQEANLILESSKEYDRPSSPAFSENQRFAPQSKRPYSSRARKLLTSRGGDYFPDSSHKRDDTVLTTVGSAVIHVTGGGRESEIIIPKTSRTVVTKGKKDTAPMRFGTTSHGLVNPQSQRSSLDLKLGNPHTMNSNNNYNNITLSDFERSQYYLQLSDSDDDDDLPRASTVPITVGRKTITNERPLTRERPHSSNVLRAIALDDPVIKVHYRYSKYCRMKHTEDHDEWLNSRNKERLIKSNIILKQLYDDNNNKASTNKKNKDKDKSNKPKRSKSKSPKRGNKSITSSNSNQTLQMNKTKPDFDIIDIDNTTNGPMRINQINECNDILEKFHEKNIPIDINTLYKALVLPQDLPDVINYEILKEKNDVDSLMVNPLPIEYHRKLNILKVKKAKKNKKKSKK